MANFHASGLVKSLVIVTVSILALQLVLSWLSSFVKEDGPELPLVINIFDEPAYQKALDHYVLDDTLCSPVLGLNVRKNKVFNVNTGSV